MLPVKTICFVIALVMFILAAASVPSRVNWLGIGLAFLTLALLVQV